MANARCTTAFSQGAYRAEVGDLVDTTHYLYQAYPGNFTLEQDVGDGGDLEFSGTLGPVLTATDGTLQYRVVVNDGGTLSTEAV